ncbi:putative catalase [Helianthus anomalus]
MLVLGLETEIRMLKSLDLQSLATLRWVRQKWFICCMVKMLSDAQVTHELRIIWISYWFQVRSPSLLWSISNKGRVLTLEKKLVSHQNARSSEYKF